ncbi:MAG: hypothetical protein WBG27_07625 [Candidatus Aquilonibacter sp.]
MVTAVRAIAAMVAILGTFWIVTILPAIEGPAEGPFLALMILPVVAAISIAPRTVRLAFVAGAIYAALAGARRLIVPEGNATVAEQLSTAAIVALLIPIVWQFWLWSGARLVRSIAKGSQSK